MSQKKPLIILGILIILTPLFGIPPAWKTGLAIVWGAFVIIIALTIGIGRYLERTNNTDMNIRKDKEEEVESESDEIEHESI